MERGYLALYRKIQDHAFYKERREFSKLEAWIDILMEAQHSEEPEEVIIGMKVLICNYGESLKSVLTWASRWSWAESKVRRFFKLLKNMGQIDYQSEVITTRLSVLNYSIYDPKRRGSDAKVKSKWRGSDAKVTTDKHDKHISIKESTKDILRKTDFAGQPEHEPEIYLTYKKRKISGKRLETFELFWDAFGDKRSKSTATDSWLDIPSLTDSLVSKIVEAAKTYSSNRQDLKDAGTTPKMAQGWLSSKRWEDEQVHEETDAEYAIRRGLN